jgi:hypothetical protein
MSRDHVFVRLGVGVSEAVLVLDSPYLSVTHCNAISKQFRNNMHCFSCDSKDNAL